MTPDEEKDVRRIRASLYEWYFCDIKKAADAATELPRLAFIGLAAWVDAVARLYSGRKGDGFSAWRKFIRRYLPVEMHAEDEVRRLYDGLRNPILHEYGTRAVALTHRHPLDHWQLIDGDIRILNLESLVAAFEEAFEAFVSDLEADAQLRALVLPHSKGLLSPVTVVRSVGSAQAVSGSISASATSISFGT